MQLTLVRKILRILAGKDLLIRTTIQKNKAWYGTSYGGFYICPDKLTESSVVYSFGIGKDISFDLDIIGKHKCFVFGFDPTPKSVEWMALQSVPEEFHFYPYGIAATTGRVDFFLPLNNEYISASFVKNSTVNEDQKVTVPVKSFKDILKDLQHQKVDVLKMDIEGAEYEVLPDILNSDCDISQILVEFHHRLVSEGANKTRESVSLLKAKGFDVFAVSESGDEVSFIKR